MLWHKIQGAGGTGGVETSIDYVGFTDLGGGTTDTLSGTVSLGAEDPNRYILMVLGCYFNAAGYNFENVTLNGNSVTTIVALDAADSVSAPSGSGIYLYYLPTGATATFTAGWTSVNSVDAGVGIYRLITSDPTPLDTSKAISSLGNSLTITKAEGTNTCLFGGSTQSSLGASASTPTNYVEDYDYDIRSNEWVTAGLCSVSSAGSTTMSASGQQYIFAASWA